MAVKFGAFEYWKAGALFSYKMWQRIMRLESESHSQEGITTLDHLENKIPIQSIIPIGMTPG